MKTIRRDMDIREYHADKTVISSTGCKHAIKSSRDFAMYLLEEQERKLTFDFGNAFEVALIDAVKGTSELDKELAIMPTEDWKDQILEDRPEIKSPVATKEYRKWKEKFIMANKGKYIIPDTGTQESKIQLDGMVNSIMSDEVIVSLLENTDYQESFFWTDKETGAKCKTRPDLSKRKKKVIIDIKTTQDASPSGFARQVAQLDYPMQACMQIDGARNTEYFDEVDEYFWLAIEKTPPYHYGWYRFQKEDMEFCWDRYRFALKRAAHVVEVLNELAEAGETASMFHFPTYGEMADNKYGLLDLNLPLWYGR